METIKNKYYRYIPGEFFPVYDGDTLVNIHEFHRYKLRRALFLIRNWRAVYHAYTHQHS